MAIRQYIGARYVPRFMGTYDNTQQYEALDVVDNGSGTSYIARKIVPAGTPLSDSDYWFVYGASSGAIYDLQTRMGAAEDDIDDLEADIAEINASKKGNLLVIGNSYVVRGVCDALETAFDNSYEFKGEGTGFVPYTGHPTCFEDQLDDAIASATFENDTITDIIFVSAVGDSRAYFYNSGSYQTDLETVLASIKTKIDNNFPNARRRVITLAESRAVANLTSTKLGSLFAVHKIFKSSPAFFGFEYIGWAGFNSLYKATRFDVDNYHPTTNGAKYIAGWLKAAYFGNADYTPIQYSKTLTCKYTNASTIAVRGSFTPDNVSLLVGNLGSTGGDPVTLSANEVMFNTEKDDIAIPGPWINHDICGKYVVVSSGADADYLAVRLNSDANGCLQATNLLTPTASTAAGSNINAPGFQGISYSI